MVYCSLGSIQSSANNATRPTIIVPPLNSTNLALQLDASNTSSFTLTGTNNTSVSRWADKLGVYNFDITAGVLDATTNGYPIYEPSNKRVFFPHGWWRDNPGIRPGYLKCSTTIAGTPLSTVNNTTGATLYVVLKNEYSANSTGNTFPLRAPFNFTGVGGASGGSGYYENLYGYSGGTGLNGYTNQCYINTLSTNGDQFGAFKISGSDSPNLLQNLHIYKVNVTGLNAFTYQYITSALNYSYTYAGGSVGGFSKDHMTLGFSFTDNYRGYLYEILIFKQAIPLAQQTEVETYLKTKWNL